MAYKAYSTQHEYEHELRWEAVNLHLRGAGYWVKWQHDFTTDSRNYAIGLKGEKQPMGIYSDEDTATAMVKMILSNAKHEGEMK
jgi:hypothetical protein